MQIKAWCKKIWETNRFLPLLTMVLAVLTLVLFLCVNWWLKPRAAELQSQLAGRQQLFNRLAGSGESRLPVGELVKRGRADIKLFWDKIPVRRDFPTLVSEVSSLATMAGLTVDRIQYSPEDMPEKKLLRYGLNFTVGGEYPKVKKFIYLIEQSERILTLDEISFLGRGDAQESGVQMNIRLSTLFKK
ncbi:MAG: type 4a pilus biogenesis protein PilO [Deltaproteobacteria bacterium]|nr:type 4a pilus biogenesis protein PilO [Deltaproteobacteria bacterium]